jgi:hypothetical protein
MVILRVKKIATKLIPNEIKLLTLKSHGQRRTALR